MQSIWVSRPGIETEIVIDWKGFVQSGRSGVELEAGDRLHVLLGPKTEPDASESSEAIVPKHWPFPTVHAAEPGHLYVVIDGGPDGRQVGVVHFNGQSVLELLGDIDEVKSDNVHASGCVPGSQWRR